MLALLDYSFAYTKFTILLVEIDFDLTSPVSKMPECWQTDCEIGTDTNVIYHWLILCAGNFSTSKLFIDDFVENLKLFETFQSCVIVCTETNGNGS